MKKILTHAACLGLFAVQCLAAEPADFQYKARLVLTPGQGLHVLAVPLDVLCKISGPADLRLFAADGHEVPFLEQVKAARYPSFTKEAVVFNSSSEREAQSFEFELPGDIPEISQLVIPTANGNFSYEVSLFGKDDGTYELIRSGMRLVAVRSPENNLNFKHETISFPPQRRRSYKLELRRVSGEFPLKITAVQASSSKTVAEERVTVPLGLEQIPGAKAEALGMRGAQAKKQSTFYLLTPPCANLPLDRFRFESSGSNFTRRAALYEQVEAPKRKEARLLASSVLFKYDSDQNLKIETRPAASAVYLLEIDQGDNLPIDIILAEGSLLKHELVFFSEDQYPLPYDLYFAGSDSGRPSYDIADRIARLKQKQTAPAFLQEAADNKSYVTRDKRPVTERLPYLIYAMVVLLVVILGVYLKKLLAASSGGSSGT